ncbi:uncharacterized protein LOC116658342 isoform X2 [Camelus ferus]|uniref:Uncharacterized protein LOC116658342 isoform X2 n=1 Tax=Camelus ferus TaxID=419612 RepID=A0A8B8RMS2_CAMFR|nr:uncharacterized protein LOC116658342 isoform X2 [Camelus ferus]
MPHRPAPRQAPIGSARPHSPRPEQQEPEHEGPRFRREEGGAHASADTHARKRMRGCACADARTARSLRKLGISAAAPEEEGGLGTGLPLAVTSAAAAGQAPIGSARPYSPHPEQQEPQPEGPRFRREEERRARTRGAAVADAGSAWSVGKLGAPAAAPEEEGGLGTGLPLAVASTAAAGQEDAVRSRGSISGGQGLSQDPALAQVLSHTC